MYHFLLPDYFHTHVLECVNNDDISHESKYELLYSRSPKITVIRTRNIKNNNLFHFFYLRKIL